MKNILFALAVGVGAVLLGSTVASAQMWGYGMGPGYGMMGPGWGMGYGYGRGAGALNNLTPEQQAQLDKLREQHFAKMSDLWNGIVKKRQELAAAQRAGDQTKVDAVTTELRDLYAKQAQEREEYGEQLADLGIAGPGYGNGYGYGPGYGMMGPGWGMGYGPYGAVRP